MKRDIGLFIEDILNSINNIEEFSRNLDKEKFSKDNFVEYALKDYQETPLTESNRPRFLELAGKGAGIIGADRDSRPNQTLNVQIKALSTHGKSPH